MGWRVRPRFAVPGIVSMLFRLILVGVSILAWAVAAWIAGYESTDPSILGRYSPPYFAVVVASIAAASLLTTAHFGPLYKRLYRSRGQLALVILSALASLGLAETAVRLLDPIGISYYEESRRYHLDKVSDEELVFRHAPHTDTVYQGARVQTNEFGFRDRPVGPRAQDEYRILVLGDSVTFGWGVDVEHVFPRLLEVALAKVLERPVRTINTAVGGYNTEQELGMAKRYVDVLKPDLMLLLYVPNDIESVQRPFNPWDRVKLAGKSPPEVVRLLAWNSWTYRLARHAWDYSSVTPDESPNVSAAGWKSSMDSMARLGTFARERGLPLFVFFSHARVTPTTDRLHEGLTVLAGRHEFVLVDTVDWFAGLDRSRYMNSIVDVHPNPLGHRIIADGIAAVLLKPPAVQQLTPEDRAARDPGR